MHMTVEAQYIYIYQLITSQPDAGEGQMKTHITLPKQPTSSLLSLLRLPLLCVIFLYLLDRSISLIFHDSLFFEIFDL